MSHRICRWFNKMFYVSTAINVIQDYKVNKNGGCTISLLKRGGVGCAWAHAKLIAGWEKPMP